MSPIATPTAGPDSTSCAERLTPEAFADAFTACSRLLWCIAAGVLGSRDAVDDVLQEGAIVALQKLDQFDPATSFTAWMGRIVRFVALNHARRLRRQGAGAVDAEVLDLIASDRSRADASSAATPAAGLAADSPADARGALRPDQASFDDALTAALGTLEGTARSCLLLRTLMDLPYREIALALDIPEGTAMSHVHRSRQALRRRLQEQPSRAAGGTAGTEASS
jgi:RNA polymerase sigma-70 factor (ECF subfamily)